MEKGVKNKKALSPSHVHRMGACIGGAGAITELTYQPKTRPLLLIDKNSFRQQQHEKISEEFASRKNRLDAKKVLKSRLPTCSSKLAAQTSATERALPEIFTTLKFFGQASIEKEGASGKKNLTSNPSKKNSPHQG
jgi:hypothetical protein